MKKILICDDEDGVTRTWRDQLEKIDAVSEQFQVLAMPMADLPALIDSLEDRRSRARTTEVISPRGLDIDDVDVLIVDYDLLKVSQFGFVTGENLAYLARCYSGVGVIIGLNQFYRDDAFDLTLSGHTESFADLNISDKQLTNPGLWRSDWPRPSFRPWYWPVVPDLVDRLRRRIQDLAGHLNEPITQYLAFPENVYDFLDREVIAFVASGAEDIRSITFRDFVKNSGQGVRGRDQCGGDELCGRIAAARVGKWLERAILPNQDVLVDLPHLVERTPSVVFDSTGDADIRGSATMANIERYKHAAIGEAAFTRADWLSRDAWWWPVIESAERLPELSEPWNFSGIPLVFCEDTSDFNEPASAHAFVSGLPSPFARRYVTRLEQIAYRPQVRFARV